MKRLELLVLSMLLLSFVVTVFPVSAEADGEYKEGCPPEAKAILDAVGGCDAINCSEYPAICEKCCPECSAEYPEACKTEDDCKAAGLHWYDDKCHVAEASESESASTPGFEAVFAAVGLLAAVSLLRRRGEV